MDDSDYRLEDLAHANRIGDLQDSAMERCLTIQGQRDWIAACLESHELRLKRAIQKEWPELKLYKGYVLLYTNMLETFDKLLKGETIGNDESLHKTLCLGCESPFSPKNSKGKFCSTRCRVAFHRKEKVTEGARSTEIA